MSKRNNWFVDYEKQRDLSYRKPFIYTNDFVNKTVIDIGCNTGQMCRYAHECGAKYILGVDYDESVIKIAKKQTTYNNIDYLTDDIDNYIFYTNLQDFDTCLFLSVIGTNELTNRYGILAKLSSKIKNVMYIEGHHSLFKKEELLKSILNYTTFTSIEYLGITYDNLSYEKQKISRDIFRCSRDIYTRENVCNKIINIFEDNKNKIIAFYGHGGVGKTTLKNYLINYLNNHTKYKFNNINKQGIITDNSDSICILDDVANYNLNLLNKYKFIIYFDYRVLEYLKSKVIDVLFIMNYNVKNRFENRPQFEYNRSLSIENSFIKNIYHIEPY